MKFRRDVCKLCSGKASIKIFRKRYYWKVYIFCRKCNCGFYGYGKNKEEAKARIVDQWNRRRHHKLPDSLISLIERER